MAHYLDTSALTKLVVEEDETEALLAFLTETERAPVSCDLARTELMRAVRRTARDRAEQARLVLDSITIIRLDPVMFDRAGHLGPASLRSLDAIHLTAALDLGDELDALVAYDERLADAAREHGMLVLSPR